MRQLSEWWGSDIPRPTAGTLLPQFLFGLEDLHQNADDKPMLLGLGGTYELPHLAYQGSR